MIRCLVSFGVLAFEIQILDTARVLRAEVGRLFGTLFNTISIYLTNCILQSRIRISQSKFDARIIAEFLINCVDLVILECTGFFILFPHKTLGTFENLGVSFQITNDEFLFREWMGISHGLVLLELEFVQYICARIVGVSATAVLNFNEY